MDLGLHYLDSVSVETCFWFCFKMKAHTIKWRKEPIYSGLMWMYIYIIRFN